MVIEVVKGGLIVDIGLRGFLPASLVELRRVRDLQPYIGQTVQAKIIELDKHRNNVVLSRRAWLEESHKEQREEFLHDLLPREVRKGVVSSVVNFGAFVDLGGMDGLIHVSELSWKHVDHPGSVVTVGDEVEVQVLDIDMSRERISLSLKATQSDPWQEFADAHKTGELVYGRVTKLVPFGSFVQVGDGIEGLVHISEMSWTQHVRHPSKIVNIGDLVEVVILKIDQENQKISLGMKQIEEDPWGMLDGKYPPNTRLEGTVRSLTNFGAFVEIEDKNILQKNILSLCEENNAKGTILLAEEGINGTISAKKDENFKIIARSDAKSVEGIDKMIERCKAYIDAGAEIIFPEALHDEKDFEKVRKELSCYLLANMTLSLIHI